jgi:type I restriction enzyme S subunit
MNDLIHTYERLKEPGSEWLGRIPRQWRVKRLKFLVSCLGGGTPNTGNPEFWGGHIPWVSPKDMKSALISATEDYLTELGVESSATSIIKPGAVLVVVRSGILRHSIPVARNVVSVALNQDMKALIPFGELSSDYLYWIIEGNQKQLLPLWSKSGCTVESIELDYMLNTKIPLPTLPEQQTITRFLDFKTAQIDALIAKKQALLDKLAEKRTALISHAVTKGLVPSVPMKDSGVAWLGEIPAHWERMLMARVISAFEQGWSPSCDEREASEEEWGVLKSGCVNYGVFQEREHKTLPASIDPIPSLEVKAGDILMCRASGSKHLIGSVALVKKCRPKLMFSDKTYRVSLQSAMIDSEFFVLVMRSKYLREQIELSISGADGLANNIPQSSVKAYQVVIPPLDEQQIIAVTLQKKIESMDTQEKKIAKAIGKLQEYRSALITNAVTGKIDVRAWQPNQEAA